MSLWSLPKTYGHIVRVQEIVLVLARHGFSHVLARLPLSEHLPGMARLRASLEKPLEGAEERSAPDRLAEAFQELGAAFIKLGQLLATRPDLVPKEYVRAFSKLQDQVEPVPFESIRQTLEDRLGAPVESVFDKFHREPVASGSIGQVHFATLRDGAQVVVKIKRPNTDERVHSDLELLAKFAPLLETYVPETRILRPRMIADEFSRMMERELDFVSEAASTARVRNDFLEDDTLLVPLVHWEHTTRDTLVLQRMEGIHLTDPDALAATGIDRVTLGRTLGRLFLRQFFVTGLFHADPHPGNIFVLDARRVALIDFGQVGHISEELRRQLAFILLALTAGNMDLIVEIYAEIGVLGEETDMKAFRNEMVALLDRYYGVPIEQLDVGEGFQETLALARRHDIRLPRDFVRMGKSFVTVIGVIQTIDPAFQFDRVVRPFTREILFNLANPVTAGRGMATYLYRIIALLRRAPDDLRDLLEKTRSGRMRLIFNHEGLETVSFRLERSVHRLTLGIIIAALMVGSSIVLNAGVEILGHWALPYVGRVPLSVLVSGLGFFAAVTMALALGWSILRDERF